MRRKVLGIVGVAAVAAVGIDCGPPPIPFAGSLNFSIRSEQAVGGPPSISLDDPIVMAQNGQGAGDNTMLLRCALQRQASGSVLFNIVMCRTGTGTCDAGRGVTFCGEVSASGLPQMASRGRVGLYVRGAQGTGPVPGQCSILVRSLFNNRDMGSQQPNAISGSIQCMGVNNMSTTGQTLNLLGRGGVDPTMEPDKADFDIQSCPTTTTAVSCM